MSIKEEKPLSVKQKKNQSNIYNQLIIGDESINANEKIIAQKARLIPIYKSGDEKALTSIFLSSLTLINEFRSMLFKTVNLSSKGKIHVFTEIEFPNTINATTEKKIIPDGLILIEKKGKIIDSAFFEMKNGKNILKEQQIEKYIILAEQYGIKKMITVSNQYVTNPSLSPLNLKKGCLKEVELFHLSWSLILTYAQILLYDNDLNIRDQDQTNIMEEIVEYMEHSSSGIMGYTKMKEGWKNLTQRIRKNDNIKEYDSDVVETIESWIQEEKDMSLGLSRKIGSFVKIYQPKTQKERSIQNNTLETVLRIDDTASDLKVTVDFKSTQIEFSTLLTANKDKKTIKGQVGHIKKQIKKMESSNPDLFKELEEYIVVNLRLLRENPYKKPISELDDFVEANKNKTLSKFGFNLIIKLTFADFSGGKKVIAKIEKYLQLYYQVVLQNLVKWEKKAPILVDTEEIE